MNWFRYDGFGGQNSRQQVLKGLGTRPVNWSSPNYRSRSPQIKQGPKCGPPSYIWTPVTTPSKQTAPSTTPCTRHVQRPCRTDTLSNKM